MGSGCSRRCNSQKRPAGHNGGDKYAFFNLKSEPPPPNNVLPLFKYQYSQQFSYQLQNLSAYYTLLEYKAQSWNLIAAILVLISVVSLYHLGDSCFFLMEKSRELSSVFGSCLLIKNVKTMLAPFMVPCLFSPWPEIIALRSQWSSAAEIKGNLE